MTVKDYLSQVRTLELIIQGLDRTYTEMQQLIEEYRQEIESDQMSEDLLLTTRRSMDHLERLQHEYTREKDQCQAKQEAVMVQISEMESDVFRRILWMRYVQKMPLNAIAYRLQYSRAYIANAHGRAIRAFSKQYPDAVRNTVRFSA